MLQNDPILVVDGLHKRYATHYAVRGISFEVNAGTIVGLLGANGAGKTTTLRIINNIIPADEGLVRVGDESLPRREVIGYLPEERGLYPRMKVLDTVVYFGRLRGLSKSDAKGAAETLLDRLELGDWLQHRVSELSKGMQQKVQFCATVVHDPQLVILDEPWSGLDPINASVIKEFVMELKDKGKGILFSTHQLSSAESMCDRVVILANGKCIANGTPAEVKSGSGIPARIKIDAAGDVETFHDKLRATGLLQDITRDDDVTSAALKPQTGVGEVLATVASLGLDIRRLTLEEPSLEDAFVASVESDNG